MANQPAAAFSEATATARRRPAILLTSYMLGATSGKNMGVSGYSYDFLVRVFRPFLQRWGEVIEVRQPESELESAARMARSRNLEPVHLSFRPFQHVCLAESVPNIVFPAWEFPDVPDIEFDGDPRSDWVDVANRCSLILTVGPFTADTLRRAGVRTPIRIVPVPTTMQYDQLPPWDDGSHTTLDCSAYVVAGSGPPDGSRHVPAGVHAGSAAVPHTGVTAKVKTSFRWIRRKLMRTGYVLARHGYRYFAKPLMPPNLFQALWCAGGGASWEWSQARRRQTLPYTPVSRVNLSGVVYTSILNPADNRKNWDDLLSGFLLAFRDRQDVTLVVKQVTSDPHLPARIMNQYRSLGVSHRCKLVFISDYLTDEQMLALARATTYYFQTTRAEGACLPLMDYLVAGRPAVSPRHSAVGDYFSGEMGFVIDSHPEPTAFPHDPELYMKTTWARLVWPSLVEQLRKSHEIAQHDRPAYDALAERAQEKMLQWSGPQSVWPHLESALELVTSSIPADVDTAGVADLKKVA